MALVLAVLLAVTTILLVFAVLAVSVMRGDRVEVKRVCGERVELIKKECEARERLLDERHRAEERVWLDEARRRDEEHSRREQALVGKLVEYAGKPPVIIDPSEAVRSIGEAISRITQGPESVLTEQTRLKQQVAENWETAMKAADPGGGVEFTPFGDVDPWMDPEAAKAHDPGRERPIEAVANGAYNGNGSGPPFSPGPSRNLVTGRPIEFRAGESGEPPRGGVED